MELSKTETIFLASSIFKQRGPVTLNTLPYWAHLAINILSFFKSSIILAAI